MLFRSVGEAEYSGGTQDLESRLTSAEGALQEGDISRQLRVSHGCVSKILGR